MTLGHLGARVGRVVDALGFARWAMVVALGVCVALINPVWADEASNASTSPPPRLATLDWGIAQNLKAMGVAPIAVGQTSGYATWVEQPELGPATHDLGLRSQPNLELLAQLAPDRILITQFYSSVEAKLSRVAPVTTVDVYFEPGDIWANTVAAVEKLGRIARRPEAAEALIRRTEHRIQAAAKRLPANTAPLLVVQFSDSQHVRVFGRRSLVHATMQRMGLKNAWTGQTTRWGVADVSLARLAEIDRGRVVVMGPVPIGLLDEIAESRLWQSLPVVRNAPVVYIPGVWSFGGLPSATRFARLVSQALRAAPVDGPGWPEPQSTSS